MPIFYFDLSNGTREPDEEGTELASLDAARTQAVWLLGEMLRFDGRPIWDGDAFLVEGFDAYRNPLFTVKAEANNLFPTG